MNARYKNSHELGTAGPAIFLCWSTALCCVFVCGDAYPLVQDYTCLLERGERETKIIFPLSQIIFSQETKARKKANDMLRWHMSESDGHLLSCPVTSPAVRPSRGERLLPNIRHLLICIAFQLPVMARGRVLGQTAETGANIALVLTKV